MDTLLNPVRTNNVVWRDIAGEVVIAERDNRTIRILNKTASLIWTLADGTRKVETITTEVCNKFEVTPEQARTDVEEFCQQLLDAGLINMNHSSHQT